MAMAVQGVFGELDMSNSDRSYRRESMLVFSYRLHELVFAILGGEK
jgi:hypothetical protein